MMKQVSRSACVRIAAGIAMSGLLAGCPFDNPDDYIARGKEMAAKQNHSGAIIEFKNALQSNPQSAEARYLLGREFLARGEVRAAEIELQRAYDAKYDRDAVVPLLVRSQLLQGQPEKISGEIIKTPLKSRAANAEVQTLLGSAALMQGRRDDAMHLYEIAQRFMPDYPAARLGKARIKAMSGDLDGASAEVEAVLAKEPNQFDGLLLKGDIARAKGLMPEAAEAYLAATKLNPRHLVARLNLAGAYIANNALDKAQEQVDQLKKLAPRDAGVTYLDALVSFTKKDYLHANDAIGVSLNENSNNGAAQILSGAVSLAMNQPAQAEVHLIEGIKLSPNSIYARRLLTGLYLRQRQPQKAREVLPPALAALPDDSNLIGLAGEIALQFGNLNEASKLFAQASKLDPANTNVKIRRGSVDLARGDEANGFAALEAAAKASDNNPAPDLALVLAHVNRHQYDQALVAWKDLEKHQPDSPVTYNLRAAIELGRNDRAEARRALERAIQIQPNFYPAVANLAALDETEGKLDAARQEFKTLLQKDSSNTSGLIGLAEFEARHGGNSDVVLPLLLEAHRSNPKAEQPITTLVSYYVSQGNLKQALAIAQEGLTGAPTREAYLALAGALQLLTGGADQAILIYRQLIIQRPDNVDYQVRLAQAMVLANQTDRAMPLFSSALKAKPAEYQLQAEAVATLLGAQKTEEASRLLADIRKASPQSPVVPELDGDVKRASKQYAEAASIYRKALAQKPSAALVLKLSLALQLAGNSADANGVLGEWLTAHPKDKDVRLSQADLALRGKDFPRAAQNYRMVVDVEPNNVDALNNLAWTLLQLKDEHALTYAQKASTLAPNNPTVSDTLGWILVEQGQIRQGLEVLEKASAGAPGQLDIALHLAKAQIKDGRRDQAKNTLQALIRARPDSAEGKESKALMATL
jgi:putative PEP-CTERM system TPR-repeat lipoprotein